MRIIIGSDHAGFELKEAVRQYLQDNDHEVYDQGTYSATESVDYPDYAIGVARAVVSGQQELGIVICGTGIGVSIAANKVHGARAALCTDAYMAKMARAHNDANILCMGARVIGQGEAVDIVEAFLTTAFAHGRHARRLEKIAAAEQA